MTEQEQQAKFEGWAICDVVGHQRYVGYVRTESYGSAVFFRVDVPELPEREYALEEPQYVCDVRDEIRSSSWCPTGTIVRRGATPGFTKLIGAGSIYTISPCDEAAAFKAIEINQRPELKLISLPAGQEILSIEGPGDDGDDKDDNPF